VDFAGTGIEILQVRSTNYGGGGGGGGWGGLRKITNPISRKKDNDLLGRGEIPVQRKGDQTSFFSLGPGQVGG